MEGSVRLIDLEPRWIGYEGERLGISFDCPHCRVQRLAVAFHHRGHEAMDDTLIRATHPTGNIWTMDGDSFENMTLSPSIDASNSGHWHGWVRNGCVT